MLLHSKRPLLQVADKKILIFRFQCWSLKNKQIMILTDPILVPKVSISFWCYIKGALWIWKWNYLHLPSGAVQLWRWVEVKFLHWFVPSFITPNARIIRFACYISVPCNIINSEELFSIFNTTTCASLKFAVQVSVHESVLCCSLTNSLALS